MLNFSLPPNIYDEHTNIPESNECGVAWCPRFIFRWISSKERCSLLNSVDVIIKSDIHCKLKKVHAFYLIPLALFKSLLSFFSLFILWIISLLLEFKDNKIIVNNFDEI